MSLPPPNHDTLPIPIIPQSRDLWLSPGVLPEEEPELGLPSPDEDQCTVPDLAQWKGVRIGFNLLPYLLRTHEMAKTLGSERADAKVHVATAGIGRIIREYGVDATEALLSFQSESGESQGTPPPQKQRESLHRILELEKIRTAVVEAAIATLRLEDHQGSLFGVTQKMIEDTKWRSAFFDRFRKLKEDLEGNIDFYGDRLSFGSALERALPRRLRKKFNQPRPLLPELQAELSKELDYLIEEGALAASIILDRDGYYAVHKGGDQTDIPRGRRKTPILTTDCLRVAIASRAGNVWSLTDREKIFDRWKVKAELDGQGFFPRRGGSSESMTPYYWFPGKAGNSPSNGGNDEAIMPFSPPLVPWEHGWWSRHANSGSGGIAQGQPSGVFSSIIAPVMRRHLAFAMKDATANVLLQARYHGTAYSRLKDWIEERPDKDKVPLIPDGFTLTDVNDMIRGLAQEVGKRAWAILHPAEALE